MGSRATRLEPVPAPKIFGTEPTLLIQPSDQVEYVVTAGPANGSLFGGTAAVVSPVGRLVSSEFDVAVGDGMAGPVTTAARNALIGIQYGLADDVHGWMLRIV